MGTEQVGKIDALVRIANAEWFTTDLTPSKTAPAGQGQKWTFHFSIDTESVVQYTLDSGITFVSLKEGAVHIANAGYEYTFIVDGGDQVNFRAVQAVTVNYSRVYIS